MAARSHRKGLGTGTKPAHPKPSTQTPAPPDIVTSHLLKHLHPVPLGCLEDLMHWIIRLDDHTATGFPCVAADDQPAIVSVDARSVVVQAWTQMDLPQRLGPYRQVQEGDITARLSDIALLHAKGEKNEVEHHLRHLRDVVQGHPEKDSSQPTSGKAALSAEKPKKRPYRDYPPFRWTDFWTWGTATEIERNKAVKSLLKLKVPLRTAQEWMWNSTYPSNRKTVIKILAMKVLKDRDALKE